ncbi:MAG: anaerobic ribonucleoside-triphosphate reductase activating protein [Prevotella sp.]|nr:anaerobic ribonucleoside-triphosphate reductase activating protein [Prevotella sp.]
MKYVNTGVVFQEIPDEVTLSINISNCPCHCLGCHSEYLWEDIGDPLNVMSLSMMLKEYGGDITCIAFMGGDATPEKVDALAAWTKKNYPELKVAWYSGRRERSSAIHLKNFDFIKLGPYVEAKGALNKPTTNQRLYKVEKDLSLTDITKKFWKK